MSDRSVFVLADAFDATEPHLRIDMDAPLPLGHCEAIRRALQLREKGGAWTWLVIATVMTEYHGFRRSPSWWKIQCRARGAAPRTRGAAFTAERNAARKAAA